MEKVHFVKSLPLLTSMVQTPDVVFSLFIVFFQPIFAGITQQVKDDKKTVRLGEWESIPQ